MTNDTDGHTPHSDDGTTGWTMRPDILWRELIHHRTVILLCFLAGIALGSAYTARQPVQNRASVSLLIAYQPLEDVNLQPEMKWTLHFFNTYYRGYNPKRSVTDHFSSSDFIQYALKRIYSGSINQQNLRRAARLVRRRLTVEAQLGEDGSPGFEVIYRSPHPEEPRRVLTGLIRFFPDYTARKFRRHLQTTLTLSRQLLERDNLQPPVRDKLAERIRNLEYSFRLNQFTEDRFALRLLDDPRFQQGMKTPIVNLLTGGTSGLIVGLLCALGLVFLDSSLRTPREVQDELDLTLLGAIPRASDGESVSPDILLHPNTPFAEAIRRVRANHQGRGARPDQQILMVTSPSPGEGKSTVAYNLAASFAQQEERVLLADFSLHRGTLHRRWNLPRSPGLTTVLSGRCSVEDALQHLDDRMDLLPAGDPLENASDLFVHRHLRELFHDLRRRYDRIILDAPAVLGRAETLTLSRLSDAILLVLRARRTHRDAARRTLGELSDVGARLAGCVLNDLTERSDLSLTFHPDSSESLAKPEQTSATSA